MGLPLYSSTVQSYSGEHSTVGHAVTAGVSFTICHGTSYTSTTQRRSWRRH